MKLGMTDQKVIYHFFSDTSEKKVRFITFLDKYYISDESQLFLNSFYYSMNTQNLMDAEPHSNENLLINLKYHGFLGSLPDVQFETAYRSYLENDEYYTRFGTESLEYDNQGISYTIGKKFDFKANSFQVRLDKTMAEFIGKSHLTANALSLDYRDTMNKNQDAVTGVWKYKTETGSHGIQWLEINTSLRYDHQRLHTEKYFVQELYPTETDSMIYYSGLTHKIGVSLSSQFDKVAYNIYALNGKNNRFFKNLFITRNRCYFKI